MGTGRRVQGVGEGPDLFHGAVETRGALEQGPDQRGADHDTVDVRGDDRGALGVEMPMPPTTGREV